MLPTSIDILFYGNFRQKVKEPCLEILKRTPISAIKIIIDVLPLDTSGSGSPVGGILPVTTNAFTTVCIPNIMVIPTASINPKTSFALDAVLSPRQIINPSNEKKKINPIKPISSPITERIKSDSANGKKAYFWRELNSPTPNHPPEPNA